MAELLKGVKLQKKDGSTANAEDVLKVTFCFFLKRNLITVYFFLNKVVISEIHSHSFVCFSKFNSLSIKKGSIMLIFFLIVFARES